MLVRYTMINQGSGSVGGLTAARNRGGNYWRKRVKPLNPDTVLQQFRRAALGGAAGAWSGLTEGQRDAWATYAETLTALNAVGETKKLSGNNAYVATNSLRTLGGQSAIANAPSFGGRPGFLPVELAEVELDPSPANNKVSFSVRASDGWNLAAGGLLFMFISQARSQGTNFYKGPFRLAHTVLRGGSAVTSPVSFTAETGPFGAWNQDAKYWARFVTMDASGRISLAQIVPMTVIGI